MQDSLDGEKGGEKNVKKKKEEQVKLLFIDGKKRSKDGVKKKDEYLEYVVIMDVEDIYKVIEGERVQWSVNVVCYFFVFMKQLLQKLCGNDI